MQDPTRWPQPSHLKSWTDQSGHEWLRAGDQPMKLVAARRAFRRKDAIFVHFFGVTPTVVLEPDELWARIEPILRGDPAVDPFSVASVWRFRDNEGRRLIAVEESY